MAIGYSLIMKDKKLTEGVLVKKIEELGYVNNSIEQLSKGIAVNLYDKVGFSAYLFDSGNYPYNTWETIFLEEDFIYERVLEFRLDKEYSDLEKRYLVILNIIFNLAEELKENAILISNGDTELAFFKEDSTIILNNESGIWNKKYFKDMLLNKNIQYLTHIIQILFLLQIKLNSDRILMWLN